MKDESGLLTQFGDGGDSAHFTGLYIMATNSDYPWLWIEFTNKGAAVRHPRQVPWNNPLNFSRDQTMPLIAGLMVQESTVTIRRLLFKTIKRLCFAQNFQRDHVGTWKYPWPHKVKSLQGVVSWRMFDFADPMLPHHIYAMSVAAKIPFYPLLPLAYLTLVLDILAARFTKKDDLGTLIATCAILNKLDWFKKLLPKWDKRLREYCLGWRKQKELYSVLSGFIRHNKGIK